MHHAFSPSDCWWSQSKTAVCCLFFCCCSFSILCFIAFLELSSAQSRTVHFKCKTRLTASEVQLQRPPCVPTEVSGKMPAECSATDPVPRLACATALQGTGILKFKHQWPVYTQMFLSSFHRDYWEQSTYSKPNLTPGKFPAHKSANALQRNMYQNGNGTGLQRRWSIPQNLCLKPCYIAAFLIVVAGRLPRVKKLLHCWGS